MKRDWTSRTTILLVGAILVVLNLVGLNLFFRVDLTDEQVYSLSDASIDLVEGLEDPVTITAFFTDDLPAPYSGNRRFLKDKLDDYRAYGGSKIQYRFVDPAADDDAREEVQRFRIPPVQIQVIESDNVQLKNAYMGLAVQYGGEREVIPVVQDLSSLEYDITSAIRRLTSEELPTVGFLTGHGEKSLFQDLQLFQQALQRNYEVETVAVRDTALSPRPDALFIVAPTDTIPEAHRRALDAYLVDGGRVAVLLNRVAADLQRGQAHVQDTGLEDLLAAYGAVVRPDLVTDEQSSVVSVSRQEGFFNVIQQIQYPFFPIATSFDADNLMVNRLGEVMFYYVSSIDTAASVPEGVTVEPLVASSPKSATQEGFFMVQPGMMPERPSYDGGPFVLAAAYTGTFPGAYDEARTSRPARLVVVGDGDFLDASIVRQVGGNLAFGLNMADWLVQDDALLAIRTKSVEPRPLAFVPEAARPWIKYANMLGPVVLVVAFGLLRWRRRRHRTIVLAPPARTPDEEPLVPA